MVKVYSVYYESNDGEQTIVRLDAPAEFDTVLEAEGELRGEIGNRFIGLCSFVQD